MYDCPLCDEKHEVIEKEIVSSSTIKGQLVSYMKKIYFCEKEQEEFCTSKQMDLNLLTARDEYRKLNGLLTSKQIKQIREKYSLTQKEFSNLLGWGDITIQRYETKSIQDSSYDNLMKMCDEYPSFCLKMLEKNKHNFETTKYNLIRKKIKELVKADGNNTLIREQIRNCYIDYDICSELNGFKLLDIDKLCSVVQYFAQYVRPLYKVKLMKLLWYADNLYFKNYGVSMTGLVYQHLPLGAVPLAHNHIMNLPSIQIEEIWNNSNIAYKINPVDRVDLNNFSIEELNVLNLVSTFFKNYNTTEIVEFMHNEKAYAQTDPNQIISYKYAKDITI